LHLRKSAIQLVNEDHLLVPYRYFRGQVFDLPLLHLLDVRVPEHIVEKGLGGIVCHEVLAQSLRELARNVRLGAPLFPDEKHRVSCEKRCQ